MINFAKLSAFFQLLLPTLLAMGGPMLDDIQLDVDDQTLLFYNDKVEL